MFLNIVVEMFTSFYTKRLVINFENIKQANIMKNIFLILIFVILHPFQWCNQSL